MVRVKERWQETVEHEDGPVLRKGQDYDPGALARVGEAAVFAGRQEPSPDAAVLRSAVSYAGGSRDQSMLVRGSGRG
jgi:hypothetical protein